MSAPAMKPEGLPERMMTPRGGDLAKDCSNASSSRMTCCESVLAEVSGLSRVSQAMPWLSRSIFQAELLIVFFTSCGAVAMHCAVVDVEIADQRTMIGEAHIRDPEVSHLNVGADQDEVQLHTRDARGEGGQFEGIG